MGRNRAWLIGLITALAGCGTSSSPAPAPEIDYLSPGGLPPVERSAFVAQPPFLLFGNLLDRLQQDSLKVTKYDEDAGYLVAEYSGDPEPFVNCGWIVTYGTGALERVSASSARSQFVREVDDRQVTLDRQLRLDGRLVVRLDPDAGSTVVRTDATYVVTKIVAALGSNGNVIGRDTETVSFNTGETGTFEKGTTCQPTGRLERVVLDSLPSVSVVGRGGAGVPRTTRPEDTTSAGIQAAVSSLSCADVRTDRGPDGSLRLTGFVRSAEDQAWLERSLGEVQGVGAIDNQLEVHPWPFCEILQVLGPYEQDGRLNVATADGGTVLRQGDDLTLDLALPQDAEYLYLGYVQRDGRVGYIATMSVREWARSAGRIRFRTGYAIDEPFGREMLVAIVSARPLFDEPRPAYEAPEPYLVALRERLAAMQAGDPDGLIMADHLFITTQSGPAF
jgi:hypothetical protein